VYKRFSSVLVQIQHWDGLPSPSIRFCPPA